MAQSRQARVSRLMLKAIRELPEKEQQVVLEYLVEMGLGPPEAAHGRGHGAKSPKEVMERLERGQLPGPIHLGVEPASWLHFARQGGGPGPDFQTIPVRLSEPQHRRLKEWCGENGFPMAVVVRGLVERFLDQQQRRAA